MDVAARVLAWLLLCAPPLVVAFFLVRRLRRGELGTGLLWVLRTGLAVCVMLVAAWSVAAVAGTPSKGADYVSAQVAASSSASQVTMIEDTEVVSTAAPSDATPAVATTAVAATPATPTTPVTTAEPASSQVPEVVPGEVAPALLRVHYLDVGQGDCEFVELPDGRTMLVDAGIADGGQSVVAYIRGLGYSHIDIVVASHPHADHIGGMHAVFSAFSIGEVWAPLAITNTATYERFLRDVEAKGLGIEQAYAGRQVLSGEGLSVDVLSPADGAQDDDLNNLSAVLRLTYGERTFIFMGDASTTVTTALGIGHVDVLKVAHHGSKTGTSRALIQELSPSFAVISCSADNTYGYPHASTLSALSGVTLYRTDLNGTITIICDGESISAASQR